jgi:beta-glucosidase
METKRTKNFKRVQFLNKKINYTMNITKIKVSFRIISILVLTFGACQQTNYNADSKIASKVDSVLREMTLEEKIGQLNQLKGKYSTDIYEQDLDIDAEIRAGRVGAITPKVDMKQKIAWQKIAVEESRLGIPLIYSADVVHGYKTIFPVPLGQAASWDMEAIEKAERVAAIEMSSQGLHWTFAPMLDITRDPRWSRGMEGPGEDPYLASQIARARVRGFQGEDLSHSNTVLACAKHFAAYGKPEGGMDYNSVDLSERELREIYLPPFEAAVDEGIATIMNAFNTVNRIPASCNPLLLKQILKTEWGFQGFTVSDANSFYELIPHGVAQDKREAALKCINAGSDTDLWGLVYIEELLQLVEDEMVEESQIDDAVRRVLRYKFKLGLFDDPYKYFDKERQNNTLLKLEHKKASLDLAKKSMVLLKNENNILPLEKGKYKTIAVIGQLAHDLEEKDMIGNWSADGDMKDVTTVLDGIKAKVGSETKVLYAKGIKAWGHYSEELLNEAVATAQKADLVILAIGENGRATGEGSSRTDISLPEDQEKLTRAIHATGKPTVMLLFNGRPLTFLWESKNMDAILVCWQPGTMAGNAAADVLWGDYNPSGKLPVTFPYNAGQIPIHYSRLNTGRPRKGPEDKRWGIAKWSDAPNEPLYPFGYGLSYTSFEYSDIILDKPSMKMDESIIVSIKISNTGKYDGEEVVQLYIRDLIADVSRPVKELKGFKKIFLKAGESKTVEFKITTEDLKYWNHEMKYVADPGEFVVFIGGDFRDVKKAKFNLIKK